MTNYFLTENNIYFDIYTLIEKNIHVYIFLSFFSLEFAYYSTVAISLSEDWRAGYK